MLGLGLSVTQLAVRGLRLTDLAAAIRSLFAAGEQGAWYDPSDLTTLYQDAAGTIPVTAVEQPVGLMLDKSGRNNHAFQTTSTNRPVLSGRYNLLTKTEQFDDAAWNLDGQALGLIRTKNTTTDPNGGNTGNKIALVSGKSAALGYIGVGTSLANRKFQLYAKPAEYSYLILLDGSFASGSYAVFDLSAGTIFRQSSTGTAVISPAANGYYLCSLTTQSNNPIHAITTSPNGSISTEGDGTSGIYIWGADLRAANDGVGLPAYQRVNTSSDYDTTGFPLYLSFNGVNQSMQTNSIDFTATDKMTVFAGVRKLSDATRGMLVELGAFSTNWFHIDAPSTARAGSYSFRSQGTILATAEAPTGYSAPIANALTGIGDISGDRATLRINGTQAASSTADQGTGKYGNYAMFIGARSGNQLWFNGRIYSLVVRGAQSTAQQITDAETYINSKTKAYA